MQTNHFPRHAPDAGRLGSTNQRAVYTALDLADLGHGQIAALKRDAVAPLFETERVVLTNNP